MNSNPITNTCLILSLMLCCTIAVSAPRQPEESQELSPQELLTALEGSDPVLREEAAGKFVESAYLWPISEVLSTALIAMEDKQAKVRVYGIASLVTFAMGSLENAAKLNPAVPALLKRLKDPDWEVRAFAAGAFSAMQPNPPPKVAPALIAMLSDANVKVAEAAMDSLVTIGFRSPEVPTKLLAMANHPNPYLQMSAIRDLANLWQGKNDVDPAVVQAFVKALSSKDEGVRSQTANYIGQFGVKADWAIPILEELAADPKESKETREAAESSITAITGRLAPQPLQQEADPAAGP